MNLLYNSDNADKICLLPFSWMWRKWSTKLKRKKFYSPLGWRRNSVSDSLSKGDNSYHRPSCGSSCGTTEKTWGSGMENLAWPRRNRYVTCKEKQSQNWSLPGKLLLQSPVGSFPDRIKGLIFILIKGLLIFQCEEQIANTIARTISALPWARRCALNWSPKQPKVRSNGEG